MNTANAPEDLFSVAGKRVLVTGSSAGIGLALAKGFAERGAQVILNGRTADKVEAARREIEALAGTPENSVQTCVFDVTDRDGLKAALAPHAASVDILINNAGMQLRGPLEAYADGDFTRIVDTNLTSAFRVAQAVVGGMIERRSGAIINICSVQSEMGRPGIAPYAATKGALKMLTKGMAIDWGRHGIRVNGLAPGYFETELNAALVADEKFSSWLVNRTPLGRWGKVEELVGGALFLASPASSFVTGQMLYVDGGVTSQL